MNYSAIVCLLSLIPAAILLAAILLGLRGRREMGGVVIVDPQPVCNRPRAEVDREYIEAAHSESADREREYWREYYRNHPEEHQTWAMFMRGEIVRQMEEMRAKNP